MNDRAKSLGMAETLAWVAGLAAFAGLVVQVFRRSTQESLGWTGVLLVPYVVYLALSIRAFWDVTRLAIPITLLMGGALWTVMLQQIDRSDLARALILTIFIPLATAYSVLLICQRRGEPGEIQECPSSPALVHDLLKKGKRLGNQSDRAAGNFLDRCSRLE
jgi:hypothetical protein